MSTKHHERRGAAEGAKPEGRQAEEKAAPNPGQGAPGGAEAEARPGDEAALAAEKARAEEAAAAAAAEIGALTERAVKAEAAAKTLAEENAGLKDQYLRKLADYENFRKRMFREKEDAQKFAVAALLGDLVPVLDDFDRAVASAEHARDYKVLHDGILLIRRQIGSLLENKYGLARYESLGKPFDPNVHEAVASDEGEVEEAMVSEEFLPGYRLHERVVRTAKVKVRMPAARPGTAGEPGAASGGGTTEGSSPGASGAASNQ